MSTVRILPAAMDAFRDASHDRNPLHLDPAYARTTTFGQPVVFGVLGLLAALGEWCGGAPLCLRHLKAVFKKPLFVDVAYSLRAELRGGRQFILLTRGPVEYMQISFEADSALPQAAAPDVAMPPLHPLPDTDQALQPSYRLDIGGLARLRAATRCTLPDGQMAALLWSSYWIGMVNPGVRALFAELEFSFEASLSGPGLQLDLAPSVRDERFNRVLHSGKGSGITQLRVAAFVRPEPVALDLGLLAGAGDAYAGLHVCVTGGARGFGAALCAGAGLQGARVSLVARGGADALADSLRAQGVKVQVIQADLGDANAVARMAEATEAFGPVDVLFLNATPPIRHAWLVEQEAEEFMAFLAQSNAMTMLPLRSLLPRLAPEAKAVLVSTVYLDDPQRGFAHYLTAKAGQEALMEVVAQELRGLRTFAARLPRMLTDQTNMPFDPLPPPRAEHVALHLLEVLASGAFEPGFSRLAVDMPEEP